MLLVILTRSGLAGGPALLSLSIYSPAGAGAIWCELYVHVYGWSLVSLLIVTCSTMLCLVWLLVVLLLALLAVIGRWQLCRCFPRSRVCGVFFLGRWRYVRLPDVRALLSVTAA